MLRTLFVLVVALSVGACAEQHENPQIGDHEVKLTFLHTSDIHSRLLPYRMQVSYTDEKMGLRQENEPFGGVARIAHIINTERARARRSLYVDSGDVFQGAPIFNVFRGEAEFRAMSYLHPDAMVIGNHEFDAGLANVVLQAKNWMAFPFIVANYAFMPDNELKDYMSPYVVVNVEGVRVGLIGLGDFSSLSSLTDIGNNLKLMALDNVQVLEQWVGILRPQVDLIVVVSHAGLRYDEELIEATSGIDIVFGGHLHIVLQPPKVLRNKVGEDVLLVHSGAFAKYVGRLEVVVKRDAQGRMRVLTHDYRLFPVDATVPEDPKMAELMMDYRYKLNQVIDLTSVYGYCPKLLTKYGYEGGDSALGNLVSEAIRRFAHVQIGFTNTLGIRANMYPGPITLDDLFNIFPFDNTITLMYMSGTDLRTMLDYNASRSSGRGCISQLQVAGLELTMNCNAALPEVYYECNDCGHKEDGEFVATDWEGCLKNCQAGCQGSVECEVECVDVGFRSCVLSRTERVEDQLCINRCMPDEDAPDFEQMRECWAGCFPRAEDIYLTECPDPLAAEDLTECKQEPLVDVQTYQVATNDYIAQGGSGFTILKSNNTQVDTGIPLREAVLETILTGGKCVEFCWDRDGDVDLQTCAVYQGCIEQVGAFKGSFCDHIDKTGGSLLTAQPKGCAADAGACKKDVDCYFPALDCAEKCASCKTASECLAEDPDSLCVDGRCMHRTHVCFDGRCARACKQDAECPGLDSDREARCADGRCLPEGSVSCLTRAECVDPFLLCYAGGGAIACQVDEDCPSQYGCRHSLCVPLRPVCKQDSDCVAGVCAFGRCSLENKPCVSDGDCGDVGICKAGLCSLPCGNCAADADCPAGLVCSKELCVEDLADCVDFRCRLRCVKDGMCQSGERCVNDLCMPAACLGEPTAQQVCELNAEFVSAQACATMPCADSTVDGRIGRILPENIEDLEFGYTPNDPEDIEGD